MKFPAGNAGVVVVICALMGAVLVGYVLSMDTHQETRTDYDYVADITGLFTKTTNPEYLEYSPPENFTGFSSGGTYYTSGIDYTPSTRATPYIVPQQNETALDESVLSGGDQLGGTLYYGERFSDKRTEKPNILKLTDWITAIDPAANTETIDISLAVNGPVLSRIAVYSDGSAVALDLSIIRAVVYMNDTNLRTVIYGHNGVVSGSWRADQLYLAYGSTIPSATTNYVPGDSVDYFTTYATPTVYMDANAGVRIVNDPVQWANGYDNSRLTIVCERPGKLYIETTVGDDDLTVSCGNDALLIVVNGTDLTTIETGSWQRFAVTLDFLGGKAYYMPITSWSGFLDYTAFTAAAYDLGISGTVEALTFTALDDNITFGIVDTWVYLDTSTIVMQDPEITITDYWTEPGRLQFNGFAYYGDSVTINGETYAVEDGRIEIRGQARELSDLVITWYDGRTTAAVGSSEFDLGQTEDYAVEFGGIWYFAAAYYQPVQVSYDAYDWQPWLFNLNTDAFILVYIGLLILGTAILHRAQTLGGGDLLIIACAGAIGYILIGVMI